MAKDSIKRPMTKIEKSVENQVYQEFNNKFGNTRWSHIKVSGNDLRYPITIAIGGVTVRQSDHKASYQYYAEGESVCLGPNQFRKVFERVRELLLPRIAEIRDARWYRMNFKGNDGKTHSIYLNADSDTEAMKQIEAYLLWSDIKPTSVYRAAWEGSRFVIGSRVRNAA